MVWFSEFPWFYIVTSMTATFKNRSENPGKPCAMLKIIWDIPEVRRSTGSKSSLKTLRHLQCKDEVHHFVIYMINI